MGALGAIAGALGILYARPILALVRFSLSNDLYSYIPLIPLTSLWLVWTRKGSLNIAANPDRRCALFPAAAGVALIAAYWLGMQSGWMPDISDYLALMVASLLLFFLGGCFLVLGSGTIRAMAFPLAFLIFMAPLPASLHDGIERMLQVASAYTAHGIFWVCFTPALQEGTSFHLPGFSLEVAPECSGIHSTYMLFITSLLAANLFLRSNLRRGLLVLAVLPLALLRNGVRIVTIGELCVHVGPQMIDSYIHRHGGWIFFGLSLIPFFLLLLKLQKSESLTASLS
jgi:exosortase C (VPDSG-CTERM-specific)